MSCDYRSFENPEFHSKRMTKHILTTPPPPQSGNLSRPHIAMQRSQPPPSPPRPLQLRPTRQPTNPHTLSDNEHGLPRPLHLRREARADHLPLLLRVQQHALPQGGPRQPAAAVHVPDVPVRGGGGHDLRVPERAEQRERRDGGSYAGRGVRPDGESCLALASFMASSAYRKEKRGENERKLLSAMEARAEWAGF